ncbi:MAG: hypothetical protein QNK37_37510 [Acidobacteriota bacterium]|nr:hypothetical protein [Acidobacteriota bacterium]
MLDSNSKIFLENKSMVQLVFDEEGLLPGNLRTVRSKKPELEDVVRKELSGSWFIRITFPDITPLQGVMRMDFNETSLKVSGDLYSPTDSSPVTKTPSENRGEWYPHFFDEDYRYYLRSSGVTLLDGVLFIPFKRLLWNNYEREFTRTERCWLQFDTFTRTPGDEADSFPKLIINGKGVIGGEACTVEAERTARRFRTAFIKVDIQKELCNHFPEKHMTIIQETFNNVGWELQFLRECRALGADVPVDDPQLDKFLDDFGRMGTGEPVESPSWRAWLLVASIFDTENTYGLMFDEEGAQREAAAVFCSQSLRDLEINGNIPELKDVPRALIRTAIHELGHIFNLIHPDDEHHHVIDHKNRPLNRTDDVIATARRKNEKFPDNALLFFSPHNRQSLIHDPDPQIRPGGNCFGYGHATCASHPSVEDIFGLPTSHRDSGLELILTSPKQSYRPLSYLYVDLRLQNTTEKSIQIPRALNIARGSLSITVKTPDRTIHRVGHIRTVCGRHDPVILAAHDFIETSIQLTYTNHGFIFEKPGEYILQAEVRFPLGDKVVSVKSGVLRIDLKGDRVFSKNIELGRAFAHGATKNRSKIEETLKSLSGSDAQTIAALALVLANDDDLDEAALQTDLNLARQQGLGERLWNLAVSVASPIHVANPEASSKNRMIRLLQE